MASSTPTPAPAASGLTSNVAAALSYITIVGIIFLVIDPYKNDKFVRFHAFQSLFLAVACIGLSIIERIIVGVLFSTSLTMLSLFATLTMIVSLAVFVLWVFLVYQAYTNKQFKLPVIGDLAAKQAGI